MLFQSAWDKSLYGPTGGGQEPQLSEFEIVDYYRENFSLSSGRKELRPYGTGLGKLSHQRDGLEGMLKHFKFNNILICRSRGQ